MKLLSIETSCDETALTIFDFSSQQDIKNIKFKVLTNHVLSQINIHREFGGVFPMLAKREHAKNIVKIFIECLKETNLYKETENNFEKEKVNKVKILLERELEMFEELIHNLEKIEKPDLEAIAVTMGPGLAPALWVGINFAKAISILWDIPIYPINHMEGHIVSSLVEPLENNDYKLKIFSSPALALLISGGHTEIISFQELNKYRKIGKTIDDAVGEAFDKVARSLNLPYPGGPEISKIAEAERQVDRIIEKSDQLPRPMLHSDNLNFSFSGLKTAVIHKIQKLKEENINETEIQKIIALDFESAVDEILIKKIKKAIKETNSRSLLIGGGVIANTFLRRSFQFLAKQENLELFIPEKFLTGDNAFMIGVAGILKILNKQKPVEIENIKANSNYNLEDL